MSAWTRIAHTEAGSGGAASVTFSSIPQTYTDLVIMASLRSESTSIGITPSFNGSTANFSGRFLEAAGSGAGSMYTASNIIAYASRSTNTASIFSNVSIYIPNYTANVNKTISVDAVTENNATEAFQLLGAVLWSDTAAISSIDLDIDQAGVDIAEFSSVTLYGVLKGSSGGVVVS